MFKGIKNNSVWNHKKVLTKYTKPNMMSLFKTSSSINSSKNKVKYSTLSLDLLVRFYFWTDPCNVFCIISNIERKNFDVLEPADS